MITISDAMLCDMKRACWMYDCYKCRHAKYGEEAAHCMEDVDNCHECTRDCACRTCDEGSNWEWKSDKEHPLTWDEVLEVKDEDVLCIETRGGRYGAVKASRIRKKHMAMRNVGDALNPGGIILLSHANYGTEWRCWREQPDCETAKDAAWNAPEEADGE